MTSIFRTPYGEMQQFIQNLHSGGFTYEDLVRINRDTVQVRRMHNTFSGTLPSMSTVLTVQMPNISWYVSAVQQLERVRQLNEQRGWGFEDMDFPSFPKKVNLRDGEVLLLCVYLPGKSEQSGLCRTFDELWDCIAVPTDYTKWRWEELQSDSKHLRQVPGYTYASGIRWVVFDPNAYYGLSSEAALEQSKLDNVELAGVEVLMAALLFSNWLSSCDETESLYPSPTGLQVMLGDGWSGVPSLDWDNDKRRLRLDASWADISDDYCSSPSIREC